VRCLAASTLLAVIFQGVLGGLRVVLVKLDLAIVHACVAQAFFCLAAMVAVVTSRWWIEAEGRSFAPSTVHARLLVFACLIAFFAIYAQLIVGATMRHYQAGLAVPDVPLAYGQLIPRTDPASLDAYNQFRAWRLNLPPVTASQIWLHMGHRLGAVLVTLLVLWASGLVFLRHRSQRALVTPASILIALIALQITLGILTVLKRKPADIASAHVAIGALILVTMFVLTVRAIRLFALVPAAAQSAGRESFEPRGPTLFQRDKIQPRCSFSLPNHSYFWWVRSRERHWPDACFDPDWSCDREIHL